MSVYRAAKIFWFFIILTVLIYSGCGRNKDQKILEAERYLSEAINFADRHKYTEAIPLFRKSIEINIELSRDSASGECYLLFAECWRKTGQYDSALGDYKSALLSFRVTGNKKLERRGKIILAEFYLSMNENTEAAALAVDAAATAKVFSDPFDEYRALALAVKAYHNNAKYDDELYRLISLMRIDSIHYESRSKLNLMREQVNAYESSNRHDLASLIYEDLISRALSMKNDSAIVQAYFTWGLIQQKSGHPDSALRAFSLAVSKMDEGMDRKIRTDILTSLGCLAYRSKHFDNARMYFWDALILAKQSDNPVKENLLQSILVACDWKLGGERSLKLVPEFLKRTSGILSNCLQDDYSMGEAFVQYIHTTINEKSGDTTDVFPLYLQAMQIYDETGWLTVDWGIDAEIIEAFMDGESSGWYDPLLRYHCLHDNVNEIFTLNEKKNLHELIRFFSRLNIKLADDRTNQAVAMVQWKYNTLKVLERDILTEISAGKNKDSERLKILTQLLSQKRTDILTSVNELTLTNFRWLLYPDPPKLNQIQDSLLSDCALIQYIPLSDRIYTLVVTRDSAFVQAREIAYSQMIGFVGEFNKLLGDPHLSDESFRLDKSATIYRIDDLAAKLGAVLIEPILPLLKNISKVYVLSPEEFGWLPIHGLRISGQPIMARFSINYLPTSAVLLFTHKQESVIQNVIGIGNPGTTNWDVEYELKDIRSFFEKARMVFEESTPLNYLDTASCDLLHFTAEFNKDIDVPDNSVVVFSDVKKLYGGNEVPLGDFFTGPSLQAIVFSNISTRAGGFWRYAPLAFLANGTPTVIATMWQGDRKAKKYFGEMFYTSLKGGLTASQAYHDAVGAMEKNPEFSRFHRWGLFYRFGK